MKKKMSIEEGFSRLGEITAQIEGSIPLEEAISLYKEGIKIAENCGQLLKKYEEDVLVLRTKADGIFALEPFEEGEHA